MKSAGHLVGILVEFAACMELGHDDLGGGHTLLLVDADRDAPAVIAYGDAGIGVDFDVYRVGMAGKGLIDSVIDDLIDHVVKTRTIVRVADIHAGAFANRLQAFENLDGICAIIVWLRGVLGHMLFFPFCCAIYTHWSG